MLQRFALVAYILLSVNSASAQAPFYQGKTITIVQGTERVGVPTPRLARCSLI